MVLPPSEEVRDEERQREADAACRALLIAAAWGAFVVLAFVVLVVVSP